RANADVLARAAVKVVADSSTVQSTNASASGIGLGGDGNADATSRISSGTTQAEAASAAALAGRSALVAATVPELNVRADADGRGAGFVAIGTAGGTVDIHAANNVLLDDHAAVTGYEGVDFRTRFDGVDTLAKTFARATGLFGHVGSDA